MIKTIKAAHLKWEQNYIVFEGFVAVALGLFAYIWGQWLGGREDICNWILSIRSTLYPTILSVFGSMFGFVVTTMANILTWIDEDKFKLLRSRPYYVDFWPTFLHAVWGLGAGTIWASISLMFDRDGCDCPLLWYLGVFIVAFVCLRLVRCVWILQKLIHAFAPPIHDE